jgi:hypothetical protein
MGRLLLPVVVRIVSALLALALIACGVVAVAEVVGAWLGHDGWVLLPDDTSERLARWRWDDSTTRWLIVGLFVTAAVALGLAIARPAPMTVVLADRPSVRFERHALERALAQDLDAVDGVDRVEVRADERQIVVRAETARRLDGEHVHTSVDQRLAESLARLRLGQPADVRVDRTNR